MKSPQVLVLLLALCLSKGVWVAAQMPNWNCHTNATGFPIDIEQMAGYWYEVARVPNVEVEQCLNVSAPANISASNEYLLDLAYINTANGNWHATREVVRFPWNDRTQNGIFDLDYSGSSSIKLTVTFKLVYTDYKSVAFICGYAGISPVPIFKLMTRERQINPAIVKVVMEMADKYSLASQIAWEQQAPEKCNGGAHQTPLSGWWLAIVVVVFQLSRRLLSANQF